MRAAELNLPNLISLGRLLLVPLAAWLIMNGRYGFAFWVLVAAGASDALDGFIAKRFDRRTRLGALLDPVADKTMLVSVYILLGITHQVLTWLVMLIVLCGIAAIPTEPYESAQIDGATHWQMFRYITLPLIAPFLFIAAMIRTIDAVKSFDTIFAITQGGPGSASETINLYLYSVAFVYYDLGYGSAIAVVFFALIVALAAVLLYLRQRTLWTEIGGGA